MRKWLILIMVLALAVLSAAWWLAQSAEKSAPPPGEVRIEIENAL